jgi:hypothetical protein
MSSTGSGEVKSSLFTVASASVDLGFSVIPVFGNRDLSKAKVAAIDWKPFQMRRATPSQLHDWFERKCFGGMAIVTGRISNLIVLDFDNQALAEQFERRFPEWLITRKVRSAARDLPHYYFRPPNGVSLQSRRLKGVDLQGEGRYVVAPPTSIEGKSYRIERGGSPRQLTTSDFEQLHRFLDELQQAEKIVVNPVKEVAPSYVNLSEVDMQSVYRSRALATGRNEALFSVALMLRDKGYSYAQAFSLLIPLHIQSGVKGETPLERQREAEATLQSAYSRPARKIHPQVVGLPTSVREELLSRNQVAVARVLDGLLLHSVPVGALTTEKSILETLDGQVGRCTILQALKALASFGQTFFEVVNPFPTPHTPTNVAIENGHGTMNQCLKIGVTSSDKNRGRPATIYRIPTIDQLCAWLGVKKTSADPLTPQDLLSPAHYRRAVHREFIKRRPAAYHVKLLARRLNVTDRTCQRYNRVCGMRLRPTFERVPLVAGMLHSLSIARAGTFLQDIQGKRYPCLVEIGQRLLAQGRLPMVCTQGFNHYSHPDGVLEVFPDLAPAPETHHKPLQAVSSDLVGTLAPAALKTPQIASGGAWANPIPKAPPQTTILDTEAQEKSAQKLYEQVKRLLGNVRDHTHQRALSLKTARRLVAEYGVEMLERAHKVLASRDNIQNYAGFLVSFLRSERTMMRLNGM